MEEKGGVDQEGGREGRREGGREEGGVYFDHFISSLSAHCWREGGEEGRGLPSFLPLLAEARTDAD